MGRILIVEDEERLASFVQKGLQSHSHAVTVAREGRVGAQLARTGEFELMLLDLGLPDQDGLELLTELRRDGVEIRVIILTAREGVGATVAGLETGADDYVTKPFRFEELLARVRVQLRDRQQAEAGTLRVGDVELDLRARTVDVRGQSVELTAREFTMLETLMEHPGQVLSREQLLSHVWGYDFDPGSNVVDVYIGYLRRKLGPGVIETVRGVGYRCAGGSGPGAAGRADEGLPPGVLPSPGADLGRAGPTRHPGGRGGDSVAG